MKQSVTSDEIIRLIGEMTEWATSPSKNADFNDGYKHATLDVINSLSGLITEGE